LKPVETRFNPFRSVQTRFQASPPPPPPSPLLPLFPFLFGRGEGEGGGRGSTTMAPPEGGGGGRSPPPLRILNKKLSKFSHSFFFKIFKICVIYPYPLKVSLSVHCCCCSKLHKHLWRRCPLNKKTKFIHSLWHTEMMI
jgi:hypothetical protein